MTWTASSSGTVTGEGKGASDDQVFDIEDAGGFDTVELTAGPSSPSDDTKDPEDDYRVLNMTIYTDTEAFDSTITYDVTATDGDGDTSFSTLDVTFDGEGDIEGTDTAEVISGSTGDDIIIGGGGDDIIFGRDGDDEIFGGEGDDLLFGGDDTSNDAASATVSVNDSAEPGGDYLYGEEGNDQLVGGEGEDYVDGGVGDDDVVGDKVEFDSDGVSTVVEDNNSTDTVIGSSGDDTAGDADLNDHIDDGTGGTIETTMEDLDSLIPPPNPEDIID